MSPENQNHRARVRPAVRLALAATLLLVVGVGAWWLLLRVTPLAPRGPATERARVGNAPPRWAPPASARSSATPPGGPKPEHALAAGLPPERAREDGPGAHLDHYGGRSGRLTADGRTGAGEARAETASTSKQPELIVWLPSLRVGAEGTTLLARLNPPADERPVALAEIAFAEGAARTPTRFRSMPRARRTGDAAGADFEWQFRPERARPPSAAGVYTPPPQAIRYLVRVHGTLAGERFERTAGGIFYLHRPGGQLAAEPLVERRQGDLVVTTEAQIERPGTYWVYAELWGEGGERPVAFARERLANLARGEHPVHLLFGGRVIRDSGVDGPYVVRNMRFQQVDTHPPHEAPPRAALAPTPGWKASEFH